MTGEVKFTARIKKAGKGSIGVTIPKPVAEAYDLKPGEYVLVSIRRIEKIKKELTQEFYK